MFNLSSLKRFSSQMHQWIFLKLGHNGPWVMGLIWCSGIVGPLSNKGPFWNLTKCFFSYNLCCTVLMVCHNETWVVVPSGILGPWSHRGPRALLMNAYKMPLLQIMLYSVDGLSSWKLGSGTFMVFRNFGSMVQQGPIWWNLTKWFFSYNFCSTVLMVCHNDTWVMNLRYVQ